MYSLRMCAFFNIAMLVCEFGYIAIVSLAPESSNADKLVENMVSSYWAERKKTRGDIYRHEYQNEKTLPLNPKVNNVKKIFFKVSSH